MGTALAAAPPQHALVSVLCGLQPYPIMQAAVVYPSTPSNKPGFVPVEWTPMYSGIAGKHQNRTPAVGGGFVSGQGATASSACWLQLVHQMLGPMLMLCGCCGWVPAPAQPPEAPPEAWHASPAARGRRVCTPAAVSSTLCACGPAGGDHWVQQQAGLQAAPDHPEQRRWFQGASCLLRRELTCTCTVIYCTPCQQHRWQPACLQTCCACEGQMASI